MTDSGDTARLDAPPLTVAESALIRRADELWRLGRFGELALELVPAVGKALRGEASREFLGTAFDLACRSLLAADEHSSAAREEVARLCRLGVECRGDQPWTDLYRGSLRHLTGAHDDAVALYQSAALDAKILYPLSNGCKTVATLSKVRSSLDPDAAGKMAVGFPAMIVHSKAKTFGRFLVVVCADHEYFARHGAAFMRSVQLHDDAVAVHLHLINPEPNDYALIERELSANKWPQLGISTELYDGPDRKSYYSCARFIRAPNFLGLYGCALLISDIDAVFCDSITRTLADLEAFDVGLFIKKKRFYGHPWQSVRAGLTLLSSSEIGRRFSTALSQLTMRIFDERKGTGLWFIDQNMLFHIWLLARTDAWGARVLDLEPRLPSLIRFGPS